ncbi:MAG: hypothetical protein A2008_08520 [Candidatus Wallbacteria bacterium GWC2_49_35]|uniref:Tetratricopeptide repeat protein n=1 Tax=Candidatus Wallbacteria bacterium GWC2_49_35 TaxID=1817813 RepID=A0A1F7WLU9_9BACT|nr:MAG: hypothetical protein A2008_08520 [Candidatus Wallbacteria bacterium GWC2_49_35]HBC73449.1 hypothetical protein [Candidatus Wallbacteria bacterium]
MKNNIKAFMPGLVLITAAAALWLFCGRAFAAPGSVRDIGQNFFAASAAAYEASASAEIRLVRAVIDGLAVASGLPEPLERLEKLSGLSNMSAAGRPAGNIDLAIASEFLEFIRASFRNSGAFEFKVRVIGERAAVYLRRSGASGGFKAGRFLPALYITKISGRWILDADYIFKLLKNQTGDLYLDAETFILAEQLWFLSQYEKFSGFKYIFNGDFVSGLSPASSGGRDVHDYIENALKGEAMHFYMCLSDFKAGRYKQAYSHISACRSMSPGNFIVETVFNMILSQRKFARLIDENFAAACGADPYNYLALMVIGEFYNVRMRYDRSVLAFEAASGLNAFLTPHYHIVYANTLEKLRNYIAAGDELAKCSVYSRDFYYTGYLAGKKYIEGGAGKKAAEEFEKVIDSLNFAETKREVAYWLMNYHAGSGNSQKFYRYRRAYFKSFFNSPTFIGVLILFWFFYMMRKTAARFIIIPTLRFLSRIYKKEGLFNKTFNAYCNFGDCEAGVKYYAEYIRSLDRSREPGAFERSSVKLGVFLLSVYRPEDAKKVFCELLSFRPDCGDALLGLGIAEYDLKNIDIALEYFMGAIEVIPENHMPYYYAGICSVLMGSKKEGIELIMISYKIDNSCESALNLCESYFLSNNMIGELVSFYDDMLVVGELTENYIQHYLKLNVSRMDATRVGKMLEKANGASITKPETYLELAVAGRELNMFSEAAATILKSMLISGGYGWLSGSGSLAFLEFAAFNLPRYRHSLLFNLQLLELGITYRRMGDNARADRAFRRIIKNSPDYAYAHFLMNDFDRSVELMAGELSESNYPWNNASIVEAIYHCLKETKNKQRLDRYREWGLHYARSISDEFGIFSYKYLKYIPKNLFLNIINGNDPDRK